MDSSSATIEQADINRLSEKDKAELRQFIGNEEQRKRIQSRSYCPMLLFPLPSVRAI